MRKWLWLLVCCVASAADLPTSAEIAATIAELGRITGFSQKRPVPISQMNRVELKKYLDDRIRNAAKPSEIRADELTLKWLGLVPEDFDLAESTIDLLTEQAAAFYDYKKRKLVLLENPIGEFDPLVLAHELAHALADQHYRIGRFMEDGAVTDDAAMARMAVVEGQASWLMTEVQLRSEGRGSLLDEGASLPPWNSLEPANSFAFPVLEKAPLYLKVSLLFPYWEGGRFQHEVLKRKGAEGFRQVFQSPPSTTQQILHPEFYFDNRGADTPPLPPWKLKGWKTLSKGTLGELDHRVIYRLADVPGGERLAAQWRGAAYQILESKRECCAVLYTSRWEDEGAAAKAMEAWSAHVRKKALHGVLAIRREGRDVIAIETPRDGGAETRVCNNCSSSPSRSDKFNGTVVIRRRSSERKRQSEMVQRREGFWVHSASFR